MIIFDGEISDNCKRQIIKRNIRMMAKIYFALTFVIGASSLILFLTGYNKVNSLIFLGLSFLFLIIAILMMFMPTKKAGRFVWKWKVEFANEKVIFTNYLSELNIIKITKGFNEIKKIIDYGNYYEVSIKKLHFYCEKSLIVQGTIEDFESLFKNLIAAKK